MKNLIAALYRSFAKTTTDLQAPILLLIRVIWGGLFIFEGWYKLSNFSTSVAFFQTLGMPVPTLMVCLAGFVQFFGGILLVLGLFTRVVSVPMIITMIVAIMVDPEAPFTLRGGTDPIETYLSQIPLTFAYMFTVTLLFGPGKWSLDYLLKDKFSTLQTEFSDYK